MNTSYASLALLCSILSCTTLVHSKTPFWQDVSMLLSGSPQSFHSVVDPLGEMTSLTYTATSGSYFNPADKNATVPGFTRDFLLEVDPPGGGARALVFVPKVRGSEISCPSYIGWMLVIAAE